MVGFNASATAHTLFSADKLALAKEHKAWQRANELFHIRRNSECEEERAAAAEAWREERETNKWIVGGPSQAWQEATGLRAFSMEDFEKSMLFRRHGIGYCPFDARVPQVPSFNLPNIDFSFHAASNTINIGIGSKIHMDKYILEVLENSVVARNSDGSFSQEGAASATALNSLLRGIGVKATWGYDAHTKQITMNFLEKLGVDTSQPFFINGTQFEVQGNKLRTIGETTQQDLQFWGFEGLNRLVAKAHALNLFNPA